MEYKKVYPPPPYTDEGSPSAPPPEQMIVQSPPPPPNPYQYQQMPQPPPAPTMHVVHQTTTIVDNAGHGMICPHCNARVRLTVERSATCTTWLLAGLLAILCCWPCVCLPCCCNWGYKTTQYCPNCKACLGSF